MFGTCLIKLHYYKSFYRYFHFFRNKNFPYKLIINQEANEKAEEIDAKAEEEFNIEKGDLSLF